MYQKKGNAMKAARCLVFVTTLKNDEMLEENITTFRKFAKIMGTTIRTYGRCHDKRAAFAHTYRPYSKNSNSNSIYSIHSPQAKYCYEWKIYRYETQAEADARHEKFIEELKKDNPVLYERCYAKYENR